MKKFLSLILVVLCACLCFVGCNNVSDSSEVVAKDGDYVLINVESVPESVVSLSDYMNSIKGGNIISVFTIENGMLTSINGKKAQGSLYWMLYTNDAEYSNSAWGSVTVEGVTYFSATLGAEELPIKADCTYIWYAQQF